MELVVKGVLGSSNRPGLEETAQSVGDWVGVCVGGSKYHEACEFYHASSQLALPGIKTALWRLSLTLLSLSSSRDPLSVWLSTELSLFSSQGDPWLCLLCHSVRLCDMDQWPLAEEESQDTGKEPGSHAHVFPTEKPPQKSAADTRWAVSSSTSHFV